MTSDMGVELQQYYAHSMDDIRIQRPVDTAEMEEEMKQKMKADMLELIVERIVDLRPQLYEAFCSLDPQNAGLVTRMEWAKVMQNTTDPGLPFLALQPDLCDVDADGNVVGRSVAAGAPPVAPGRAEGLDDVAAVEEAVALAAVPRAVGPSLRLPPAPTLLFLPSALLLALRGADPALLLVRLAAVSLRLLRLPRHSILPRCLQPRPRHPRKG